MTRYEATTASSGPSSLSMSTSSDLTSPSGSSLTKPAGGAAGSSSMVPNVPSSAHLMRSMPAADSRKRCLQAMVVVVRPAYSRRSSGAMSDILKSFCTSTPVTSCGSWTPVSMASLSGGGMEASRPTTLAVLSCLKGMRSSSQFLGLKTLTLLVLLALRERSLDLRRIMLCTSPWTRI